MTFTELRSLAGAGVLGPADLVWHPSLPQWVPAGQVGGLFAPLPGPVAQSLRHSRPDASGRRSRRLLWLVGPLVALVLVGAGLGIFFGLRGGGEDATGGGSESSSGGTTVTRPTGTTVAAVPVTTAASVTTTAASVTTTAAAVATTAGATRPPRWLPGSGQNSALWRRPRPDISRDGLGHGRRR